MEKIINEQVNFKFDIYERIKLDRSEREIKEIFTSGLKVFVSAALDGDNIEIIGSLVLNIEYFSIETVPSFSFTHSVPVEIRIPANCFTNINFIKARIVNFDVEHVGSYVLNLTGVLEITEVYPESVDLPKAIETTASPNEVAADKGILTEEELKELESLKLAIDAIGMIVTAEILKGNESKFLYTILGIVKMMEEETK